MNVEVNNLSYFINEKTTLRKVNARFEKGKVCALMGPSGAGKVLQSKILERN
jgi:ABC-type multidrug transport system ATPase subunit